MAIGVVLLCFALYGAGYFLYSRWLALRVFALRRDAITPAHALEDGVDYVPSRRGVLFGHHYASITGLSPMLGPAIAVIWGWIPALLWVAFGAVMIGCVHDFGSLVVSARAEGKSIGVVAERLMGRRAKASCTRSSSLASRWRWASLSMSSHSYSGQETQRPRLDTTRKR